MPVSRSDSLLHVAHYTNDSVADLSTIRVETFCYDSALLYPSQYVPGIDNAESAAEIFGSHSTVAADVAAYREAQRLPLVDSVNVVVLHALVLALFVMAVNVVYRFRSNIATLFKLLASPTWLADVKSEKSVTFAMMINFCNVMGTLSLVAILSAVYIEYGSVEGMPAAGLIDTYITPIIAVALLLLAVYRMFAHWMIYKITVDRDLVSELIFFRRTLFALYSLILTPFAMVVSMNFDDKGYFVLPIVVILLIIIVVYHTIKSFRFFMCKKISILQWFLYLCTVEIFPVSFYVLMLLR